MIEYNGYIIDRCPVCDGTNSVSDENNIIGDSNECEYCKGTRWVPFPVKKLLKIYGFEDEV